MLHEMPAGRFAEVAGTSARPSFGRLLRSHRERAGLTQQALAGLSTVGARTIRDLESERARARIRTVALLADGLRLHGRPRDQFVQAALAGRADPLEPRTPFPTPELVNPLVGRDLEVNAMVEALTSGRRRVISLCGLPGVGKTRLAAEIAARLSSQHGWVVTWMALGAGGPRAAPHGPVAADHAQVLDDLHADGGQDALLVLDDAHIGAVPGGLRSVLASLSRVRVLSTSQAFFYLSGVQPTVLTPLATPGPEWDAGAASPGPPHPDQLCLDRLGQVPAVHLLVDRLREVRTGFAPDGGNAGSLVAVSRRCDGLPLVLELMASLFRVLSLDEMARMPEGELLALTPTGRAGGDRGGGRSIGDLFRASVGRLDERRRDVLRELAASPRDRTVADVAAALRRSRAELTEDLNVLIGHGLLDTTPGEGATHLVMPGLLRASLRRCTSHGFRCRTTQTHVRGDCVLGPVAARSLRQPLATPQSEEETWPTTHWTRCAPPD